jgi:spore coat protein JC
MWAYEKKLQYPINIKNPSAANAKIIISQLGGPDGELGASIRYLTQRYSAPYGRIKGLLTDIGTEELGHVEMVSTLVYQLTRDLSVDQIKKQGFADYFVDQRTVKIGTNVKKLLKIAAVRVIH